MASEQQRAEKDTRERQGEGNRDNNLQHLAKVHRGGRTKGEHLEVKGYQQEEMDSTGGVAQPKKEQRGTEGHKEMGHRDPAGESSVDEGIDIDECTG